MHSLVVEIRRSVVAKGVLAVVLAQLVATHWVCAETLTGIVKQPEPPYRGAPNATVRVLDATTSNRVAGPDTTDKDGRYVFDVPKDMEVVVHASWRSGRSTPGVKKVKVATSPTQADVLLQLPVSAAPEAWLEAGRRTARLDEGSVELVPASLKEAKVPAAAIFQFVLGAREEKGDAFAGVLHTKIFKSADPAVVTRALQEAETQFNATGTVPDLQELAVRSRTSLTEAEHLEILGLIAPWAVRPSDPSEEGQWESAVALAVGAQPQRQVLRTRDLFSNVLFDAAH